MKEEIELHKFSPGDTCFAEVNGAIRDDATVVAVSDFGVSISITGRHDPLPLCFARVFRTPAEVADHLSAEAGRLRAQAGRQDKLAELYRRTRGDYRPIYDLH